MVGRSINTQAKVVGNYRLETLFNRKSVLIHAVAGDLEKTDKCQTAVRAVLTGEVHRIICDVGPMDDHSSDKCRLTEPYPDPVRMRI